MIHISTRAPGTILYASVCAAVLLGGCCALVVALCGPPVWARELQGWAPPDGAVSDPEPPVETDETPGEPEPETEPDPDLEPEQDPVPEPPAPLRAQASSSIRTLGKDEVPPGARERLRARILRQN